MREKLTETIDNLLANRESKEDMISITVERSLRSAGLHDHVDIAVQVAKEAYRGGSSDFRAIQAGKRYGFNQEIIK